MFYPRTPFTKCTEIESQILKRNAPFLKELFEWLCKTPKSTTYRVNLLRTNPEVIRKQIETELMKKYKQIPKIYIIPEIPEVISISNLHTVDDRNVVPIDGLNEIIVDTSCGASVLRGAHVYAPGVIAMKTGTKITDDVNVYADLEGNCLKGTNIEYESNEKIFLGTGIVRMARYQLYGENINSNGIAIEMNHTISGVPSIGDLSSSDVLLQNFPSIVCCRVLQPQPGETVLDMCSAPGNKTTHIAELMQDSGHIVALDKTETKIKRVRDKILERNLKSIRCFVFDSTKALGTIENGTTEPPFRPETFDKILLDAPCSALGNRPLLSCGQTAKMLQSHPKLQKKLFRVAVGLLKQNGILVYSTCTVAEDENEGIVRWALDTFPELTLVKAEPKFGADGLENVGLSNEERKFVQRFGPDSSDDRFDSVGFFIAKFRKE